MTTEEFEHLMRRLRPKLLGIGRKMFADSTMAEDVAQETLMRLWMMRERIDSAGGAEALAVRIARNVCVSEWRRKQSSPCVAMPLPGKGRGKPTARGSGALTARGSEEYDAIVAGRRRQTMTRVAAWLAAAVIVGAVFLGTLMHWDSYPKGDGKGQQLAELAASKAVNGKKAESSFGSSKSSFGSPAETVMAQAAAKPAAVHNSKKEAGKRLATVKETMDADKDAAMIDRVRQVEQMLNEIGDSVYLAHVEEMIESNGELQRLAEYITRNDAGRYRYATLYEDEMLEEQDEENNEQKEF